jgi:hypothetical protein
MSRVLPPTAPITMGLYDCGGHVVATVRCGSVGGHPLHAAACSASGCHAAIYTNSTFDGAVVWLRGHLLTHGTDPAGLAIQLGVQRHRPDGWWMHARMARRTVEQLFGTSSETQRWAS